MAKTGRNDPCPCGSGEKYKHCCIDKKDNVIPFPVDSFKRYQNIADGWDDSDGPRPTFMESMGQSNPATEAVRELQEQMGNMEFSSTEDADAFLKKQMETKNSEPFRGFLGLSPAIMHSILNFDFKGNSNILTINSGITSNEADGAPAVKQCRYLLEKAGENEKGLKATQKGNLPVKIARDFYDRFIKAHDIIKQTPRGEDDVKELQKAKFFLRDSGYIKFYMGWYSLTKKGRAMVNDFDHSAFYLQLFIYFNETYNWLYGTRYPEAIGFLQHSVIFNYYILRENAKEFISGDLLGRLYLEAFPDLEQGSNHEHALSTVVHAYTYMFLYEIAYYLGLLDIRGDRRILTSELSYRTTDLFDSVIKWKL